MEPLALATQSSLVDKLSAFMPEKLSIYELMPCMIGRVLGQTAVAFFKQNYGCI